MNALKKIYYNCRKATFLIEKKQFGSIRFNEHLELLFHLACCDFCRTYQKQSHMINRSIKKLIDKNFHNETGMDEKFKEELHQKIIKHLDAI